MTKKIRVDEKEYNIDKLTEEAKIQVIGVQFADKRLKELENLYLVMEQAKNSYIDNLKKEMISDKAGFLFDD